MLSDQLQISEHQVNCWLVARLGKGIGCVLPLSNVPYHPPPPQFFIANVTSSLPCMFVIIVEDCAALSYQRVSFLHSRVLGFVCFLFLRTLFLEQEFV